MPGALPPEPDLSTFGSPALHRHAGSPTAAASSPAAHVALPRHHVVPAVWACRCFYWPTILSGGPLPLCFFIQRRSLPLHHELPADRALLCLHMPQA